MKTEKDLEVLDLWKSPNGNLFLKVNEYYSLALGSKNNIGPYVASGSDFPLKAPYVKASNIVPVVKVGRIVWDKPQKRKKKEVDNSRKRCPYCDRSLKEPKIGDSEEEAKILKAHVKKFHSEKYFKDKWNTDIAG